ncbi:uncharacterized protein MONOS_5858 [Monocercomonoides exilis]|uniref:uncharacterized protein n=1 Tax=Monocercomonoides exilis TaxID=2049356 RepID=UPI0035599B65|nr:hypothetical protein MONOS_5858 [Monocercomonoides exilis]|eukprot:MONOS_5858.1-p1 / transcript=MONOS_5858.1 / gene=MONOS_5858 / organism=Monocercomonoides_exilis_PA203 / gene_product=unspecified product / transcript_product=unspecified product / location=Mono_scaffold00176:35023-35500(+) / protein_length=87 / sequence_SO=supercontig / SO=protein_coding / is_pseudo=false
MIDGGVIASKKNTAVTVVPLNPGAKPMFYKFVKACYTSFDNSQLAVQIRHSFMIYPAIKYFSYFIWDSFASLHVSSIHVFANEHIF